jgi:hypothetical protein
MTTRVRRDAEGLGTVRKECDGKEKSALASVAAPAALAPKRESTPEQATGMQ